MGFNISGIAVSKNLQNNITEIEKEIGFKLELIEEIDFEEASSNWKDDGICDIYFGKDGTLIFLSHDLSTDAYSILNLLTFTFAVSETSMVFCFHYCENGKLRRSRAEAEEQELSSEGDKLDIEYTSTDISEIIWELIDKTIGEEFMEIDVADKAYRYQLVKIENIEKGKSDDSIDSKSIGDSLKTPLLIVKISKWIIMVGLIFTALSLTTIYDNIVGIFVIIFGIIVQLGSTWFMNNLKARNEE